MSNAGRLVTSEDGYGIIPARDLRKAIPIENRAHRVGVRVTGRRDSVGELGHFEIDEVGDVLGLSYWTAAPPSGPPLDGGTAVEIPPAAAAFVGGMAAVPPPLDGTPGPGGPTTPGAPGNGGGSGGGSGGPTTPVVPGTPGGGSPTSNTRPLSAWRHVWPVVRTTRGSTGGGKPTIPGPITPPGGPGPDSRTPGGPITPPTGPFVPYPPGAINGPSGPGAINNLVPGSPGGGGGGGGDGRSPSLPGDGPHEVGDGAVVLPTIGPAWAADGRWTAKRWDWIGASTTSAAKYRQPLGWPSIPGGFYGLVVATTDDNDEIETWHPTDPRLVSPNAGGTASHATVVTDLTAKGDVDQQRTAGLHTLCRVIVKPKGDMSFTGTPGNSLALQLSLTGTGDISGGLWCDGEKGTKCNLGSPSIRNGGPIECPNGGCKHTFATDGDGNPIAPVHFSWSSLFRKGSNKSDLQKYDGPLRFEEFMPYTWEFPFPARVHMGWDPGLTYYLPRDGTGNGRPYQGMWSWWVGIVLGGDDDDVPMEGGLVPNPGGITTDTPFDPFPNTPAFQPNSLVQAGSSQTLLRRITGWTPSEIAIPSLAFRPQRIASGERDLRSGLKMSRSEIRRARKTFPSVLRMESFGKQAGDSWAYTQKPGASRSAGGTAPGGTWLMPPEFDMTDAALNFAAQGVTASESWFGIAPGVRVGFGYPDPATGKLRTGISAEGQTDGTLKLYSYNASGVATHLATIDGAAKTIATAEDVKLAVGSARAMVALWTQTADKAIANTTTPTSINETGVGSTTLPAGFVRAGLMVKERHLGVYSTKAGSPGTLTVDVQVGGVSLVSTVCDMPSGITSLRARLDVQRTLRATGSSGSMICAALLELVDATGASGDTIRAYSINGSPTTINWDTNSRVMDVVLTWSTADIANTITWRVADMWAVN